MDRPRRGPAAEAEAARRARERLADAEAAPAAPRQTADSHVAAARQRPAEPGDRLSPYWTNPEPSPLAVKGYRDWVEEQIQKAMARGEFDNLPGRGKPLNLTENPFEKDWMVHHILKNAGMAPEWIELRREIQADLAWLREHPDHPDREERIRQVNRRIDRYNLLVPTPDLQYPRLTAATAPGARPTPTTAPATGAPQSTTGEARRRPEGSP